MIGVKQSHSSLMTLLLTGFMPVSKERILGTKKQLFLSFFCCSSLSVFFSYKHSPSSFQQSVERSLSEIKYRTNIRILEASLSEESKVGDHRS